VCVCVCVCVCETWSGAKTLSWIEVLYSRLILRNVTYGFVTMTYMGRITNIYKDVSIVKNIQNTALCFRSELLPSSGENTNPKKQFTTFYVLLTARLDNRVKKNQPDAQLILSIFRQPLHVSGVSRPIIRRYSRMYTTIGTYYFFKMTDSVVLVGLESNPTRTTDSHLKRIISANCIHTVVPPDDGPRYARNM